jgi:flagellar biosynthesis protein
LAFGGKGSQAKLEVFSERKPGKGPSQQTFVAYLVFTVETEKNGRVQWNVHLKGRQLSLQVFAPDSDMEDLSILVGEIERALEGKGFYLMGKAIFLDKPFRVPDGFRLNVTGWPLASPPRRNPRKSAVAVQYDRTAMGAPQLTAKGRGLVAERLVALARANGIPVVEDRLLVEALEKLDLNREIPAELYQVVAEILVAVYKSENR